MQVISSAEFATHQQKYFNMARRQDVLVENKNRRYRITAEPMEEEQEILHPDDDLRSAISAEEFKKQALDIVDKVHYKFYGDERQVCPRNT
jgi:hypothetical protein